MGGGVKKDIPPCRGPYRALLWINTYLVRVT